MIHYLKNLNLDNYQFTSISQENQVINSIRFLYKFGLDKKYDKVSFKRPKSEKKLPRVIDGDFIKERLSKIENLKHKAILTLTYSVGLRVSEIVNLKIEDVDSKRMLIHIKNAKGRKDRLVPLSPNVLNLLREYFKELPKSPSNKNATIQLIMKNSNTGFGDIKPEDKVCYNCEHLAWMIGIGQGLRCTNPKKEIKLEMVPSSKHTCELFKSKNK